MSNSHYSASDGAAYERFIGRWSRRVAERLPDYLEPLGDGPLLDVGTGTGSVALVLKARYPNRSILGVDLSRPYLDFAAARQDAEGIEFAVGDACNLDGIEDHRFGASVALIVLNFVKDPLAAALEMKRVTRPGGKVLLSGWDFRGGLVYQRLLWDTASVLDPEAAERRDRIFSGPLALPDGMVDLLNEAGLAEVKRDWITIRMDFADFDDYWQPLLGGQGPVGSYVAGLEAGKRTEIEEAVRRAFLCGAPDGPRSLTATAWVVSAIVP